MNIYVGNLSYTMTQEDLINEKVEENPDFHLVDLKTNNSSNIHIEIDQKSDPL